MDVSTAARKKHMPAFETAVRNCIMPGKRGQKREVTISEADAQEMYNFYFKHVAQDREQALTAIGVASRRAAAKSAAASVFVFVAMLTLLVAFIFKSVWATMCVLLVSALVIYFFWARRRVAQKIWANRKGFKRGTEEALEKMCLILALTPLRSAKMPIVGGLAAAAAVCAYKFITTLIGG
ncbi:MAG: hypothetical protein K5663_04355 [Clostridiales bacterium]|nr:hypothetical protein [Clostridiales bacterium]